MTKKFTAISQEEFNNLLKEFDDKKNNNIDKTKIAICSNKDFWWICPKGHSYNCKMSNRTVKRYNCPYCSGQKIISGENDLLTLEPELCKEWDYNKNIISPSTVSVQSHTKVWWICSLNHSYKSEICNRTNKNKSGCPYCSGNKLLKGFNDLASQFPELLTEWDYSKNTISPDEINKHSTLKTWWKCSLEHSWKVPVVKRTYQKTQCPYCNGRKIWKGFNDFASCYPEKLKFWDYSKNIIKPDEISKCSGKKVWWKCIKDHSWQTTIAHIVNSNSNYHCPYCDKSKQTSFGEQTIFYYLKEHKYNPINRYKYNKKEIDIFLPSLNIGIEFNGLYYHSNKKQKDKEKEQFLSQYMKIFYICEGTKNYKYRNKIYFDCKHKYNQNLEWAINKLFNAINFKININIEKDKQKIYNQYK